MAQTECPKCNGTKWARIETSQGPARERCECYYRAEQSTGVRRIGIPPRFQEATFDDFDTGSEEENPYRYETLTAAYYRASQFAKDFPASEKPGLLLYGGSPSTSTHLAVAVLKVLLEKNLSCAFFDCQWLLDTLLESGHSGADRSERSSAIERRLKEVDVLVLDAVGERRPTDWGVDTLRALIKERYYKKGGLIVTTALPINPNIPAQVDNRARTEPLENIRDKLPDLIGSESAARLYDHCDLICMNENPPKSGSQGRGRSAS